MKHNRIVAMLLGAVLASNAHARPTPLSSAITYQGQLKSAGTPYNGTADFTFALFDAAAAGPQIGGTISVNAVVVTNGTFTVSLDFGALAFNGDDRFLEIAVHAPSNGGGGPFTTLSPRQKLAAAPYALRAMNISELQTGLITFSNAGNAYAGSALAIDGSTLRVDSDNHRVGIGTATPTHTLMIQSAIPDALRLTGPGAFGTSATMNFEDSVGNVYLQNDIDGGLVVNTNGSLGGRLALLGGNVGIGTTAPIDVLTVAGAGTAISTIDDTVQTRLFSSAATGKGYVGTNSNHPFVIRTGPTDRITIDTAGNVGVGTTFPAAKLDVNGTVNAASYSMPTTTRHLSIPCVAFSPLTTSLTIDKTPPALNGTTPGQSVVVTAPVNLPDGAVITSVSADVLDNSTTTDITVRLTRWPLASPPTEFLGLVSSTGSSASVQTITDNTIVTPVVDNLNETYSVEVFFTTPAAPTFNVQLRRVLITYTITSPLP